MSRIPKNLITLCITLMVLLFSATLASAAPNPPGDLGVVPRYTNPITLMLTWTDNSNDETGFCIERREQGAAAFILLTNVGANTTSYIDATATSDRMWEYQVCASNASGNSSYTAISHATSPRQVWLLNDGDHDILHNFGTPLNFSGRRYFHEGVDVSSSNQRVDAARGGVVTGVNPPAVNGGELWLNVDFGAGPEVDVYMHTIIDAVWGAGDMIAPGERVGSVNNNWFHFDVEANHVHWGDGHRNNLIPYTVDADRDPNMQTPVVADINNDGHDFIVVPANNNNHTNPRDPAWGDVDFIVDAYDDMAPNLNLMSSPHKIGYWIEAGISGAENVRNAAEPYYLIKFDFPLHGGAAAHPLENAVVYWNLNADLQGINTWQTCLSWLVTNTKGTDGAQGNVDANQFWRTDARKDTGAWPNGSDAQNARENQEAKFPDGTYFTHIILEDLVHQSDNIRSVLIDNSRPYVRRVTVYSGTRIVYQARWVWNGTTAQLSLEPVDFNSAAAFAALRTQDITIEIEFSEPMQSASITDINPLGVVPTLTSTQPAHARTIWRGIISNLDIADDGSDDGTHMMTITGKDLAGNQLLQINNNTSMGPNHHNRDAAGNMQGTPGNDTIHGFRIGSLEGTIPVIAIFMKQGDTDPVSPTISDKSLQLQQALNHYFNEVSYNEISFTVEGHGWYKLDHPLAWYYTQPQTPLIDLVQEAITKGETNGINMQNTDYVFVVTDENSARDEWSTPGAWSYNVTPAPGWNLIAGATLNLASTDAHVSNLAGRMVGLIDLFEYPEVIVSRPFVGPWSHMSDKEHEVHVLGWEKWRANWVDETGTASGKTVTRIPKPSPTTPIVDQTYTILPTDSNNNGVKMLAIEIGNRLYYTVEYRRQQNLDTALPDNGVLIVKTNDAINQGEGPAIVQESPITSGNLTDAPFKLTAPCDEFNDTGSGVKIEVITINDNQAQIRLNYAIPPHENDVYVALHDDRWKTEDIWIDAPDIAGNFAADPLTVKDADEKPVVNHPNKVYARVRNSGHADATNFEVRLEIREPWGVGGPWRELKVDTVTLLQGQDNNPNAYYLISGDWTPSGDVHSCVQVTVTGVANDINTENNWTQENISEFVTSPGSPYAPVTTRFEVENPYKEQILVFFKLDGVPEGWSYMITPQRLQIPAKGIGKVQVTIQPHNEAPLCSQENVTITAFTPRVDTLKRLGAITLNINLKSAANLSGKSWGECGKPVDQKITAVTHVDNKPRQCVIYANGCTNPKQPNKTVAVIYTAPDGTKTVHYVNTDQNGCYNDLLTVGTPGLWQTQAVLPETDCRAAAETPVQPVNVGDVTPTGAFKYFFHFGPNFPFGSANRIWDPGFSLNLGLERSYKNNILIQGTIGFHQFYNDAPDENLHFSEISVNAKYIFAPTPEKYMFLQSGTGYYIPKYGNSTVGVNAGVGTNWILTPKLGIDLGVYYHYINYTQNINKIKSFNFATIQAGINWRL